SNQESPWASKISGDGAGGDRVRLCSAQTSNRRLMLPCTRGDVRLNRLARGLLEAQCSLGSVRARRRRRRALRKRRLGCGGSDRHHEIGFLPGIGRIPVYVAWNVAVSVVATPGRPVLDAAVVVTGHFR